MYKRQVSTIGVAASLHHKDPVHCLLPMHCKAAKLEEEEFCINDRTVPNVGSDGQLDHIDVTVTRQSPLV